jgi:hypothetical protein
MQCKHEDHKSVNKSIFCKTVIYVKNMSNSITGHVHFGFHCVGFENKTELQHTVILQWPPLIFWDVMGHRLVVTEVLRQPTGPIIKSQAVTDYQLMPCNIPEE